MMHLQISVLHSNHFMLIPVISHSGIELPAMYKVNTLNLVDRNYTYYCRTSIVEIIHPY